MNPARRIKIQGLGFCALALAFTVLVSLTKMISGPAEIIFLSVMIGTLGVPHGALDTLFAKTVFHLDSIGKWILFIIFYLLIAALVLQIWIQFSIVFLIGFLAISIFHFSGDPEKNVPAFNRLLYGGAIIFLPALFHSSEVARLFSFLVNSDQVIDLVQVMRLISIPWTAGLILVTFKRRAEDSLGALETISVAALALFVSPLSAFTIFFCGMHSARHMLRMSQLTKSSSPHGLHLYLAAAILPTLAVGCVAAVVWLIPAENSMDARLVQIVFVGLAALTVPHMVLLDGSTFLKRYLSRFYLNQTLQKLSKLKQILINLIFLYAKS